MIAWKLILIAVSASTGTANPPPPRPQIETFQSYTSCMEAADLYRRVPGVGARCLPDGDPNVQPRIIYRGPAPLDRLPYGAVPNGAGGYVYPLPRLAPPQGPAPWPQDY